MPDTSPITSIPAADFSDWTCSQVDVGWTCALALGWHFMFADILGWCQLVFWPDSPPMPELTGTETLITVLMSLLGLGGLRTVEKLKGVSR